ncbi:MAG: hypothetical protein R2684_05930 [Pyrinomonadaceae bacterium]
MNNQLNLDEVIEGYAIETPSGNDPVVLDGWIKQYPQFEAELLEFAASRAVAQKTDYPELTIEEKRKAREISARILRNAGVPELENELHGIVDRGNEIASNKMKLAADLGIGLSTLLAIDRRRVAFESIPTSFVERISTVLRVTKEAVINYLSQDRIIAPSASYKSTGRPDPNMTQDLETVLELDSEVSEEMKNRIMRSC